MFELRFTPEAQRSLSEMEHDASAKKRLNAVRRALGYLQKNPRHPSLHTHKFDSLRGPHGEEVFEAYAENKTPTAYRIFWCYGPAQKLITVIAITPHP